MTTYILFQKSHGETFNAEFGWGDYANPIFTEVDRTEAASLKDAEAYWRKERKIKFSGVGAKFFVDEA